MNPDYIVYDDNIIAVGLFAKDTEADNNHLLHLGIRWLLPTPYTNKRGERVEVTNVMNGETQWFLLPHTFGTAVARTLIEQKVADCGLAESFKVDGFKRMVTWLVEMEELQDAMCY